MDRSRRRLLATLGVAVAGSLSGCPADDGSTSTDGGETPSASAPNSSTPAGDTDGSTPDVAVEDLPRECVTAEFDGYTGTTPVPSPERPAEVTPDAAAAYVEAYETYYLRYVALYAHGPPTPADTGVSAHGFPDVTLAQIETDVLDAGDGWAVVRLRYDRFVEGESEGRYTVTYYVSTDHLARASVEGDATPGPDPTTEGTLQTC